MHKLFLIPLSLSGLRVAWFNEPSYMECHWHSWESFIILV